jgi:hypothetical protein
MKHVFAISFLLVVIFFAIAGQGRPRMIDFRAALASLGLGYGPPELSAPRSKTARPAARENEPIAQAPKIAPPMELGPIGALEAPLSNALVTTAAKEVSLPHGTMTLNAGVAVTLLHDRGTEVDVLWQGKLVTLPRAAVRNVTAPDTDEPPALFAGAAETSTRPEASYALSPLASFGHASSLRIGGLDADENRRVWNTYDGRFHPYDGYWSRTWIVVNGQPVCHYSPPGTTIARDGTGQYRRTETVAVRTVSSSNTSPVRLSNAPQYAVTSYSPGSSSQYRSTTTSSGASAARTVSGGTRQTRPATVVRTIPARASVR